MSLEIIRWIAHELRLPLLEEEEDGAIRCNVEALQRLDGESPSDLRAGALALVSAPHISSVRRGRLDGSDFCSRALRFVRAPQYVDDVSEGGGKWPKQVGGGG